MKKISNKEFAWYLGAGLVVAIGIIFIVFGIIGDNMNGLTSNNFIAQFEDKIHFSLRYLGIIFIAVGAFVAICALIYNAKRADRDVEKKIRREQRIAAQASQSFEVKDAVQIVEEPQK